MEKEPTPISIGAQTERLTKRPYQPPVLTDVGHISSLTRGASGSVGDGVAGMNMTACL